MSLVQRTTGAIGTLNREAMTAARARQARLTKPPGSLGRLEDVSVWLAGVRGTAAPRIAAPAVVVAAADHGVSAQGVSAYPAEVTGQMVANFLAGGAAINVLARQAGARVVIVDAGVATAPASHPNLRSLRAGPGTADIGAGPAMSRETAVRVLEHGITLAAELAAEGTDLVATGDMGIGNTTPSAAIVAACTGLPPAVVTGLGTGIDAERRAHKIAVVERALAQNAPDPSDGVALLAAVGGFEIGLLAGVMLGAAAGRVPVVLDGFITTAAALIARAISPEAVAFMLASHRSVEPGHGAALDLLGLEPLLSLNLRLGEGSGAALAIPIVRAAAAILTDMATFEQAGVANAAEPVAGEGAFGSM